MVINRAQKREQKIQKAIEDLARGEISLEKYHEISEQAYIESLKDEEEERAEQEKEKVAR